MSAPFRRAWLLSAPLLLAAAAPKARAPAAPSKPTTEAPAASPREAPPSTVKAEAPRSEGRVTYVGARRAYVDAGRFEGLSEAQRLALRRGTKAAAECVVEALSDHHATCIGTGVEEGDRFALAAMPAAPVTFAAGPGVAKPAEAEQARRREALGAQPFEPVLFRGDSERAGTRRRLETTLSHATWAVPGGDAYQQERVDVAMRGVPVAGGFELSAVATALGWSARPGGAHYQPGHPAQLLVRELELSARSSSRPWTLSSGRLWPWFLPGVSVLDGVQAGWRPSNRSEVGAFAGSLPDPVTLGMGFSRTAAGVYWAGRRTSDAGVWRLVRHESRLGLLSTPEGGQRLEGEALVQATFAHAVDATGDVRVSTAAGKVGLAAGRFDVTARPRDGIRLIAGWRQFGDALATLEGNALASAGSRHLTASGTWDVSPRMTVRFDGGRALDLRSDASRTFAGPEFGFPGLFGARGGLSVGWLEEFGWSRGRSGWVQSLLAPAGRWQLLARLGYTDDPGADSGRARGANLSAIASTPLPHGLSLRLSGMVRAGLTAASEGVLDGGYTLSAALRGAL